MSYQQDPRPGVLVIGFGLVIVLYFVLLHGKKIIDLVF